MSSAALRSLRRSPLSWQQESLLRRDTRFGAGEVSAVFELEDDVSESELLRRVQRMAAREPGLRAVDYDLDGVVYADSPQIPVDSVECDGPDEAGQYVRANRSVDFERSEGPLWNITLIQHRGRDGRPARTVFVRLDHFVADRCTAALVRRELSTGMENPATAGAGGYLNWLSRQRAEFDERTGPGSNAAAFWQRHLDGASPNQATPLPVFADEPAAQRQGTAWYNVRVPVSATALRAACRGAAATPFVLVLASVTATTAASSGADDLVLRLITSGRTPSSAATIGWLNTSIPIRLRHPELAAFDGALSAARTSWAEMLPYQHSPWEYIWRMCAPAGAPSHGWQAGPRQLVVNYFPDTVSGLGAVDFEDRHDEFEQDYPALYVVPLASGGFLFRLIAHVSDVDAEAGRRFLHTLRDRFLRDVDRAADGRP